MAKIEPIPYDAFSELFYRFGIDPLVFYKLSEGRVTGWFPSMASRKPLVDVEKLAEVLWENIDV